MTGKRIPELDGLRVLMIFVVSWFHIWQQSWLTPVVSLPGFRYSLDWLVRSGYVWVDGTILLSSFLMYLPLARNGRETLPDVKAFYLRKAGRLLPAYYFLLLAVFFGICLPWNLYNHNGPYMVKDLATHFTLTFTFFSDTYLATPLGAASWTLAVVAQGYALFPLLAAGMKKHPARTLGGMAAVCLGFRAWCLWGLTDYSMVVNALINFLDVYVIGFLAAMAYPRLEKRFGNPPEGRQAWRGYAGKTAATLLFAGCLWGLCRLLRVQAMSPDHARLQANQMIFRPAFALGFAGLILTAPFSLRPLRKLLGNRVTKFLAGISMNYYLIHQVLIVHMKRISFPPSVSDTPNMAGEQPWQTQYTLLAFGLSLAAAVLVTYLIEKPAGKWFGRITSSCSSAQRPGSSPMEQTPVS